MHTKHKKDEIAWDIQVRSGERKKSVFEIMLEERDKASKLPERLLCVSFAVGCAVAAGI